MKKHYPCASCTRCPFVHHYELYLKDILLALDAIERLVQHMELEAFMQDRARSSTVIRKFALIARALEHIPAEFQAQHPEVAWERLASLQHEWSADTSPPIDYQAQWAVLQREILPELKPKVEEIVVNL